MAVTVGSSQIQAIGSYLGVGRETAWGTRVSGSDALCFLSNNLTTKKEGKLLEEIVRNRSRAYRERISISKIIDGDVGFYYRARSEACNYILQQAFGGTVSSAEVSTAVAYLHTIQMGDMTNNAPTSTSSDLQGLSIAVRKGDSSTGKNFEYVGCRVNELNFAAEIDDALMCTASFVGKDSSVGTADHESTLTFADVTPLVFTGGRISVEDSIGACTSTAYYHVQSVEFGISNNLKSEADSRRIGSDLLDVLPAGVATINLSMSLRFDTITSYNNMINATRLACEIEFTGDTLTGASSTESLKFQFPKIYVNAGADPEIGGPDEILKTDLEFHCIADSSAGYALQALLQNGTANYEI